DDTTGTGDQSAVDSVDAPPTSAATDDEPAGTGTGEAADRDKWIAVGADYLDGGDREFDECLSAGVVDGLGYDNLSASGTTPEEFWSTADLTGFDIDVGGMGGVAENLVECG